MTHKLTAIIEREGNGYVALCPELDIASQGDTIEMARTNIKEAVELFIDHASSKEIASRLHGEIYVTQFEVSHAVTQPGNGVFVALEYNVSGAMSMLSGQHKTPIS